MATMTVDARTLVGNTTAQILKGVDLQLQIGLRNNYTEFGNNCKSTMVDEVDFRYFSFTGWID